jgi:hypothetical protein
LTREGRASLHGDRDRAGKFENFSTQLSHFKQQTRSVRALFSVQTAARQPLPTVEYIFERSKEHLIAFVSIAFISILSRRPKRLVVEELSA